MKDKVWFVVTFVNGYLVQLIRITNFTKHENQCHQFKVWQSVFKFLVQTVILTFFDVLFCPLFKTFALKIFTRKVNKQNSVAIIRDK